MSIEYYHVHKTEPTKSIDNITKDIKDRDNKKRVQDIIRSIPIDFGPPAVFKILKGWRSTD